MVKTNRSFRPKHYEDVWVHLNGEYVLGKFIGYDHVTDETLVKVNKQYIRLTPQILSYNKIQNK